MPLLADGAMGTELLARSGLAGLPARLNLLRPDLVLVLHREYVAAGARLLVANTLGGSPDEVSVGVRLARESAAEGGNQGAHPLLAPAAGGEEVLVAASVDPGKAEQIEAAAEADFPIFETITSLRALRQPNRPAIATLSFGADGTLDGLTPAEVARRMQDLGFAAWGYGCGFGPEHARPILAKLRKAAPQATLIAKPNLGLPPYAITPNQLAAWAKDMARLGIQIVGACCGSTPAHIRAVAEALVD